MAPTLSGSVGRREKIRVNASHGSGFVTGPAHRGDEALASAGMA